MSGGQIPEGQLHGLHMPSQAQSQAQSQSQSQPQPLPLSRRSAGHDVSRHALSGIRHRPKPAASLRTKQPSACTECRRRKQKCNLGNPCLNCARRFPQPICEYSTGKIRRQSSVRKSPEDGDESSTGPYSHLDVSEVGDAISSIEEPLMSGDGRTALPMRLKRELESQALALSRHYREPDIYDDAASLMPNDFISDAEWDELRKRARRTTASMNPLVASILQDRLRHARRIINDEGDDGGAKFLRSLFQATSRPSPPIGNLDDEVNHLPMVPTRLNKELVRSHLQLLSRFKVSMDGNPHPDNRFMRRWIPFSLQDPLVLHVVMFTSASFLHEAGRLPREAVLAYKNMVHEMLKEHIASPALQLSDSAIMAVAHMLLTCWLWGATDDLRVHMKGLKVMLTMRGGLEGLGLEGYISKLILAQDIAIALAHDTEPMLFCRPGFNYDDPSRMPFQVAYNSPLSFDCPPFAIPTATLKLHPYTAQILDDVRFLFQVVLSQPEDASTEQLEHVQKTAKEMLEKISALPAELTPDEAQGFSPDSGIYSQSSPEAIAEDAEGGSGEGGVSPGSASTSTRSQPSRDGSSIVTDFLRRESRESETTRGMYRCVRETAMLYCRAIEARRPTEEMIGKDEFTQMWWSTWFVHLEKWKAATGIFFWIMVALVPISHGAPPARLAKTMMIVVVMSISMDNWHTAVDAAQVAFRLQRWLRGRGPTLNFDDKTGRDTVAEGLDVTTEQKGYLRRHDPPIDVSLEPPDD